MVLNTFSSGNHLRGFFRRSFREIKKREIKYLVVDVRNNGGGDAGNSTLLTKYSSKKKFKLADSLYTNRRSSRYGKHIELQPLYWLWTLFVTHKADDGTIPFWLFLNGIIINRSAGFITMDRYIFLLVGILSLPLLFLPKPYKANQM